VHLAQANVSPNERAGELYAVNAVATLGLAEHAAACGARRFVLASSGAVYGFADEPLAEDAPCLGESFYSITKIHAERFAALFAERLDVSVLRLFFPYGSGLPSTRLVADVVRRVRDGVPVRLNEGARPVINPVYISDVVGAILGCLDGQGGGVFNVAGPETCDIRELAERAGAAVGRSPVFDDGGTAPGDLVGDIARLRELLGREPISLADGLASMVEPS
jgi:UDP-glucose 4-epimerase